MRSIAKAGRDRGRGQVQGARLGNGGPNRCTCRERRAHPRRPSRRCADPPGFRRTPSGVRTVRAECRRRAGGGRWQRYGDGSPLEDRPGGPGACALPWCSYHFGRAELPERRRCGRRSTVPPHRQGRRRPAGGLACGRLRQIIVHRAERAGIDGRVSGHSLRVGSAQSLAAAGVGLVELQEAGDWKSPNMPSYYARNQLAARGAVARLRHGVGEQQSEASLNPPGIFPPGG